MVCTTFLHSCELNVPTSNKEVNELLAEVRRALPDEDIQILERCHYFKPGFFKKRQLRRTFEVYVYVGGVGPWQVINFYRQGSDTSINLSNDADVVVAWLYGIIAGIHHSKRMYKAAE